ncbi:MAG: hypothetical protein ABI557_07080, partial [Aureliella sp.]
MIEWLGTNAHLQNIGKQVNQAALACVLVTCLPTLSTELRSEESPAAEVSFERAQLSDQFTSEGGTFGDYDGDGHGDVAVGPWIYYGRSFTNSSRY